LLTACASKAVIGEPASAVAFREIIGHKDIMGEDLYQHGDTGAILEEMVAKMLAGSDAVARTIAEYLTK